MPLLGVNLETASTVGFETMAGMASGTGALALTTKVLGLE